MKNKRYDKTKIKQRSSTTKPATTGPWPYIPVNVLEHEFLFLETNEAFTVLHNTANASNSKGYLLSSRLPAEWKVAIEVKGKKKKTKSDMDVWVDIIYQHRALCWHALSLAIADILRVHALHVCLNKKADKEYLSVSSI